MDATTPIEHAGTVYPSYRKLAAEIGMAPATLKYRLDSGMSVDAAIDTPIQTPLTIRLFGKNYASLGEALDAFNTPKPRYKNRRSVRDWPMELAIIAPVGARLSDFDGCNFDLANMPEREFNTYIEAIIGPRLIAASKQSNVSSPLTKQWVLTKKWS